ncbi:CrcB family protein [Novosphingobium sp.]|uniref:CrcB family protein n=1 Tax=Novosphingobium sp. TaxID=1874826 RepID=UPI0025F39CD9|nr:CrcB family protein [Novosphingobium sp.]
MPPDFTTASLLVAGGGAFGAWLRFATGRLWSMAIGPVAASAFPWSTLTVNVLGSLAMGLLAGWLARNTGSNSIHPESWRLLLGVGVLGGYTTFSAFALEFALFVERGALGLAALYTGLSLLAGFAALFAGLFIMRTV